MKKYMLVLSILTLNSMLYAQNPEQRGLEIAKKADLVDQGFESTVVDLTMILKNKQGQETTRSLTNQTLELTEEW